MRRATIAVAVLVAGVARGQVAVTTHHNDAARTGQNVAETILKPANVAPATFGKRLHQHVDGYVYAQPLYLPGVTVPGKGTHDVVYVATEHGTVYAFDAGSKSGPNRAPLWKVGNDRRAGQRSVPSHDTGCEDLVPEIGITSTPVIDTAAGTLYVVNKTKEHGAYLQRLHALDVATGAEKLGGPVTIAASVPGSGDGSDGGMIAFDPLRQHQRAGLALANGVVYIAWASHCDNGPYHGWVMGYDAATLAQVAVWNATPEGGLAGIWMAGAAPAVDGAGNLFLSTGNGTFDASGGGSDYGDTVLRLSAPLAVADSFTPFNQLILNLGDGDLGSGGALLLPPQPGTHPNLLVTAGKEGRIYLLDRDAMGGFHAGSDSQIVQSIPDVLAGGSFDTPAFWNDRVYYLADGDDLKAFALAGGMLSTTPVSESNQAFGFPGATVSISANGASDGIAWVIERRGANTPGVLHAYDAGDLAQSLWDSEQDRRDRPGIAVKFTVPTVADGRVFVGAVKRLTVYGLR